MERVNTKSQIVNGREVMTTTDGKWYRAIDLANALGNNFIYTATKSLEDVGASGITGVFKTNLNEREYKFVNLDKLKSEWSKHEEDVKSDKSKSRTTYQSVKKAMTLIKEATEGSTTKITMDLNEHKDRANKGVSSVNIILEELVKISQQLDSKETMEKMQEISKENSSLKKTITALQSQIELSEKKYEELKNFNLKAVAERDRLASENEQLKIFKSNIQKMLGQG